MKRSLYIFGFALISSLLIVRESKADVSVNISGNASGSYSEVSVRNTINSSSSTTSTTNNHTTVHIESNGQVQDYNSDTGEDVNMQSDDGHTKVNITNRKNTESTVSEIPTLIPTLTGSQASTVSGSKEKELQDNKIKEQKKNMQIGMQNIFQSILSFFRNLFSKH